LGLRHALTVLLALLAPGQALPAGSCTACHPVHFEASGACATCHRGDPRSRRPEVAHRDLIPGRFAHFAVPGSPVVARGQRLVDQAGCRRCHVIAGRGNGLAADLDRLLPGGRPAESLAAIQQPALFMPRFAFTEAAAVEAVNALYAGAAKAPPRAGETPQVVHFETARPRVSAFEQRCGGCHRMLTRAQGGLGAGATGPNLSGLFGEFYPGVFREGERWAPANLKRWVANPREARPLALMPPLRLTAEAWEAVLASFEAGASSAR
jgi:cytochrome c2